MHLNVGSFSLFECMVFYGALNIRSVTLRHFMGDTSTNKDIYIMFKVFGRPDLSSYPRSPVPDADALALLPPPKLYPFVSTRKHVVLINLIID